MNKERKKRLAKEGFAILRARYKKLFGSAKPLAIGVGDEILSQAKEGELQKLRFALRRYCNGVNYLKAVRDGTHRYGLNGKKLQEISDEERERASLMIKDAYKNISAANRKR